MQSHLATGEDARRAVRSATIAVVIPGRPDQPHEYSCHRLLRVHSPGAGSIPSAGVGRYAVRASRSVLADDGFQSEAAAQFAGKQALAEFLAELSKEEKRPRK
jgi:hypothetical protein